MSDASVDNVVLVTVDSLRADAVGAYDPARHTPVLDDLADVVDRYLVAHLECLVDAVCHEQDGGIDSRLDVEEPF